MTETLKFTARIPERFVEFEFRLYGDETIEDENVLEALDEKAWDTVYDNGYNVQVFDSNGLEVPIPSRSVALKDEKDGGDNGCAV
jgi:hypothetical protein